MELVDPEMKDRNVSVKLKRVKVDDEGRYECCVVINRSKRNITTIILKVGEPGESVSLDQS